MFPILFPFFFFNDTATTEIYTLSLHDALPIFLAGDVAARGLVELDELGARRHEAAQLDRKSTRLNSSHSQISYAVFCLKKKKLKDTAIDNLREDVVAQDNVVRLPDTMSIVVAR